jgi:hypothetical protein
MGFVTAFRCEREKSRSAGFKEVDMESGKSGFADSDVGTSAHKSVRPIRGFGGPWLALSVAFALHVTDEALTGFLAVYNPTVEAMRARLGWFPMPTFGFREWLLGLVFGVVVCLALTLAAWKGARWLRPLAWFYAGLMFMNGMGHTVFTVLGGTVETVRFARPAPGFYSSPLLLASSTWLAVRLWRTRG